MSQEIIRKFTEYYENYSLETLDSCDQVYSSELKFIDPFHEIDGRENFVEYSRNLMKNVHECRFDIQHVFRKENEAQITAKVAIQRLLISPLKNMQYFLEHYSPFYYLYLCYHQAFKRGKPEIHPLLEKVSNYLSKAIPKMSKVHLAQKPRVISVPLLDARLSAVVSENETPCAASTAPASDGSLAIGSR